eukprot:TRINITY_DN8099_c0_g1_i1.p1 TRINITY_DN8099_c0_g1~~TRINITY_DN8099_c0_g1_i1.p1  ORF type:complete len:350 (-),score=92.74 TRINITY_DN8099_c0_g1_i1:177-1226(-)
METIMQDHVFTPRGVLVTGGAGFIGSHMVIHLVKKYPGCRVVSFDKLDYCSSERNLDQVKDAPNFKFIKGNICSADFVAFVLRVEEIDTIIHFAAHTHVDNSFGNSLQFTENNVMGTHQLLEAVRVYGGIRRFIHVSTDEVYGSLDSEGHETSSVLHPTNPYAATKAGAEFLVQAYHKSHAIPTIITRSNNVYGPQQFPEKIVPKFILLLERGKPCPVHGDGSEVRNFLYISDVIAAYDLILHRGTVGETYNIGTSFGLPNLEVARAILREYGLGDREQEFISFVENRPFNDLRYMINSEKLHRLGWHPAVDWDDGLRETISWYRKHGEGYWPVIENALVPHPREGMKL